jgi:uncharacterized membrane protein
MWSLLEHVWRALQDNWPWMAWNLTLALIPLVLAIPLFRRDRRPSVKWWLGMLAFIALLPNAPYVLTDVVHFVPNVRNTERLSVALAFIVQYGVFFLVGAESYVVSIVLFTRWLAARGWARAAVPVEVGINLLCSIGIYLGRVRRLNSWDIVVAPGRFVASLSGLGSVRAIALTALAFFVVSFAYWTGKYVTLALAAYRPRVHANASR